MPTTSPTSPVSGTTSTAQSAPKDRMQHARQCVVPMADRMSAESDEGDYFIRQADLDRACLQRGRG